MAKGFGRRRRRQDEDDDSDGKKLPWEVDESLEDRAHMSDEAPKGLRYALWRLTHPQRAFVHMSEREERK